MCRALTPYRRSQRQTSAVETVRRDWIVRR
jgi:hypothetical protein